MLHSILKINKGVVFLLSKRLMIIGCSLLLLFLVNGCANNDNQQSSSQSEENEDVVAIVNGEEVMKEELDQSVEQMKQSYIQSGMAPEQLSEEMVNELQQNALDLIINSKILIQAADKEGYEPSEEEVNEQLKQMTEQFQSEEELNKALEMNNLTMDQLKQELAKSIKMDKYLQNNIGEVNVSEAEMKDAYNQYSQQQENFPAYEEVKEQIKQEILDRKQQEEVQKLVQQLRDDSEVEILI